MLGWFKESKESVSIKRIVMMLDEERGVKSYIADNVLFIDLDSVCKSVFGNNS